MRLLIKEGDGWYGGLTLQVSKLIPFIRFFIRVVSKISQLLNTLG